MASREKLSFFTIRSPWTRLLFVAPLATKQHVVPCEIASYLAVGLTLGLTLDNAATWLLATWGLIPIAQQPFSVTVIWLLWNDQNAILFGFDPMCAEHVLFLCKELCCGISSISVTPS
ncbi:Hypothetical predicted protein [Prunus dulcis]|uniref:Uncharacterized protein n=1 Tax=Prunus dulcis TaxID=3755 RepID=A0A5E4FLQ4_PRUDU|nr:Hypothetical predicted protein [Prunus dulcis]